MSRTTKQRSGSFLTWLSPAVVCLFLFSCAQGGGIGEVLEEIAGAGGGTAGVSGNTGSSPVCGDGRVEGLEQCDGVNLNSATCGSLGEGSGTLNCSSSCTYDLSMCSGSGSSGYGG